MPTTVLQGIVDPKTLRILEEVIDNPSKLYHLNSLAEATNVPISTTLRIVRTLREQQILTEHPIGKLKVYQLADNDKARILRGLFS